MLGSFIPVIYIVIQIVRYVGNGESINSYAINEKKKEKIQ